MKKIITTGIVSMFLLLGFSTFTTLGAEQKNFDINLQQGWVEITLDPDEEWNFGTVPYSQTRSKDFVIRCKGTQSAKIRVFLKESCDPHECFSLDYEGYTWIEPSGTHTITASYTAKGPLLSGWSADLCVDWWDEDDIKHREEAHLIGKTGGRGKTAFFFLNQQYTTEMVNNIVQIDQQTN